MTKLIEYGPSIVLGAIICVALFFFSLHNDSARNTVLTEALQTSIQKNAENWRIIATNTDKIARNSEKQQEIIEKLQIIVTGLHKDTITFETRLLLEKFVKDMRKVYLTENSDPLHVDLLNQILKKLEEKSDVNPVN